MKQKLAITSLAFGFLLLSGVAAHAQVVVTAPVHVPFWSPRHSLGMRYRVMTPVVPPIVVTPSIRPHAHAMPMPIPTAPAVVVPAPAAPPAVVAPSVAPLAPSVVEARDGWLRRLGRRIGERHLMHRDMAAAHHLRIQVPTPFPTVPAPQAQVEIEVAPVAPIAPHPHPTPAAPVEPIPSELLPPQPTPAGPRSF